jgi:crossover junction endodeoxyribonuclease RusA
MPDSGAQAGGAVLTRITLPFPPSTNNLFINSSRGRFRSQKYDEWIKEAGWELARQRPSKFVGPVVLLFHFQDGLDKRKRDVTNLIKAPEDLLVRHGIIEADDNSIVRGVEAYWNAAVTGVQITIESVSNRVPTNQTKEECDERTEHRA